MVSQEHRDQSLLSWLRAVLNHLSAGKGQIHLERMGTTGIFCSIADLDRVMDLAEAGYKAQPRQIVEAAIAHPGRCTAPVCAGIHARQTEADDG